LTTAHRIAPAGVPERLRGGHTYAEDSSADTHHLAAIGIYGGAVAVAALVARKRNLPVADVGVWDTVRMALATYKGARLLSKEKVAAPLRAPFAQREGDGEGSEVHDVPVGEGARRTVGELVTCPFCVGQWVVTGLAAGLVLAPRFTRLVASTLTAAAGADFLHYAYAAAQQLPKTLEARGHA